MAIDDVLNVLGALMLLAYAIASLFWPHPIARLIAQQLETPRGVTEFRVLNGGYFVGLALFALIVNQPLVYTALGVGWLGAAGARLFGYVVDRPPLEPNFIGYLALEIALGAMMMV